MWRRHHDWPVGSVGRAAPAVPASLLLGAPVLPLHRIMVDAGEKFLCTRASFQPAGRRDGPAVGVTALLVGAGRLAPHSRSVWSTSSAALLDTLPPDGWRPPSPRTAAAQRGR